MEFNPALRSYFHYLFQIYSCWNWQYPLSLASLISLLIWALRIWHGGGLSCTNSFILLPCSCDLIVIFIFLIYNLVGTIQLYNVQLFSWTRFFLIFWVEYSDWITDWKSVTQILTFDREINLLEFCILATSGLCICLWNDSDLGVHCWTFTQTKAIETLLKGYSTGWSWLSQIIHQNLELGHFLFTHYSCCQTCKKYEKILYYSFFFQEMLKNNSKLCN